MALTSLACQTQFTVNWNGTRSVSGLTALQNSTSFSKSFQFTLGAAVALGCNLIAAGLVSLAGGANSSLDLTSIADVTSTTVTLARTKGCVFCLLASTDSAPDGTAGTGCSSVTIGNGTNPHKLFLTTNTFTFTLNNGAGIAWTDPGASGVTVDATNKTIKVLNNDGSVTAKLFYAILGAES